MDFRTPVNLPKRAPSITETSHILFLGSCFAEHIGQEIQQSMPQGQVCINPFGILYNPESIYVALETLLHGSLFFPDNYMFKGRDQLWHSWLHSTHFSSERQDICRDNILTSYDQAASFIRKADLLCVTFGTNHAYLHRTEGYVVGNCHKEPAKHFDEVILHISTITQKWNLLLNDLERECPHLQIIFTVSPYRYAKHGLHQNQLIKAELLLAIHQLCSTHKNAIYFPAYEIVIDELRDYRFYAEDMLHPSAQAIQYVWQRFRDWTFTPAALLQAQQEKKRRKREAHRPIIR